MESSRAAVEVRKLQYMDERQTCAGKFHTLALQRQQSRAGNARCGRPDGNSKKQNPAWKEAGSCRAMR